MAASLEILNVFADEVVNFTGLTPFTFFLGTIGLAVTLLVLDLNKGASLEIPGRGQIGLSAGLFIFGSLVMILSAEGYEFFFTEIAKTTLSLLIVTPIVYYLIGRK